MKIEVRPIPITKWHRKKGKESFSRPVRIGALVDPETMEYSTGLTDEEVIEFSERLNVDLSPIYNPNEPHTYWDQMTSSVKLENRTMFFDTERIQDIIKIKLLKASKFVANSMREYEEGLYPDATHVIYDEREEVEIAASKVAVKNKATMEVAELSDARKAQIILLLSGKNLRGKKGSFITVELDKLIQKDAKLVLRYIQRDVEMVATEALVREAIQKNVLKTQGHKIMYHDSVLGSELDDVAIYLNQPENQDLKIRLLETINIS